MASSPPRIPLGRKAAAERLLEVLAEEVIPRETLERLGILDFIEAFVAGEGGAPELLRILGDLYLHWGVNPGWVLTGVGEPTVDLPLPAPVRPSPSPSPASGVLPSLHISSPS